MKKRSYRVKIICEQHAQILEKNLNHFLEGIEGENIVNIKFCHNGKGEGYKAFVVYWA